MIKFLGIVLLLLLPLILIALYLGRRMEDNEDKADNDQAIREGLKALKRRILNIEKLRDSRREK